MAQRLDGAADRVQLTADGKAHGNQGQVERRRGHTVQEVHGELDQVQRAEMPVVHGVRRHGQVRVVDVHPVPAERPVPVPDGGHGAVERERANGEESHGHREYGEHGARRTQGAPTPSLPRALVINVAAAAIPLGPFVGPFQAPAQLARPAHDGDRLVRA